MDMFFVISGFVITRSNLVAIDAGTFKWWQFYQRRLRRLMPALLLVLVATIAMGWFSMMPGVYHRLGASTLAAVAFVPNWLLWSEGGYFDIGASAKPLLHLWSLGVEEQFYLLWPLAAVFFGRGRRFAFILSVGALLSLLYCAWLTPLDRDAAFYLPFSRIWEPAIGCLLALCPPRDGGRLNHALSVLAVAGLLASVCLIGEDGFPGLAALLPVVATAMLLASGPRSIVNSRLINRRLMTWIGRISYPLYLWHWPILVFASMQFGPSLSAATLVVLLVVAVLLASLTYHFVELPLRRSFALPVLAYAGLGGAALAGLFAFWVYETGGALLRYPPTVRPVLAYQTYAYQDDARYPTCWLRDDQPLSEAADTCTPPPGLPGPSVAIWGDSHAARLYPGLHAVVGDNVAQFTRNACPPIMDTGSHGCQVGNAAVIAEMRQNPPDQVLLFAAWFNHDGWSGDAPILGRIDRTISDLQAAGVARITLIGPGPNFGGDLPSQIFGYWQRNHRLPDRLAGSPNDQNRQIDAALALFAQERKIEFFSIYDVLCEQAGCLTHIPGDQADLVSWDYGHLTTPGAEWLADQMVAAGVLRSNKGTDLQ